MGKIIVLYLLALIVGGEIYFGIQYFANAQPMSNFSIVVFGILSATCIVILYALITSVIGDLLDRRSMIRNGRIIQWSMALEQCKAGTGTFVFSGCLYFVPSGIEKHFALFKNDHNKVELNTEFLKKSEWLLVLEVPKEFERHIPNKQFIDSRLAKLVTLRVNDPRPT